MAKALVGIKVLDFTQFEAGTSCTETLAWLGADVIKVESPRGEPGRYLLRTPDEVKNNIDSWYYISLNANKRSITLDVRTAKGLAMVKELVKKVDVVASNFAPGTMDDLGIGYAVLSKINPKLIYAVNSGFGMTGLYSKFSAFDTIGKAAGSAYSNNGLASTPPLNPGPTVGDTGSGMHMAIGILAAYIAAQRTGKGQIVDQSMSDACMNLNRVPAAIAGSFAGTPAPRAVATDTVKCKGDGPNDYALVITATLAQLKALMKVCGREDFVTPDMKDLSTIFPKMAEINAILAEWAKTKTKMEVFETLAPLGVPCAPILDTVEVLNNPHFIERGMSVEWNHPKRGKFRMPGCAVKLSDSPVDYKIAPTLGQDNHEVYSELLNLSKEQVDQLKAEKVI